MAKLLEKNNVSCRFIMHEEVQGDEIFLVNAEYTNIEIAYQV